ncbi:MAG: signal peptidase I [Planctomycetes bacterium]|nr:signal peptidase I [Planctomycetota bacterium]
MNKPKTPPEEQPVDASLQRKRAQVTQFRRWLKRVRIAFAVGTVFLAVYIFMSYGVYTVPGEYRPLSNKVQSPITEVQPGDTVILLNLNMWREPKLGDIVIYDHPDPKDGVPSQLIGRVAGLPGEVVTRTGPTMQVGGRLPLPVGFPLGKDVQVKDNATIPEGSYLVVTDTDAIAYADSRDFGYVKREAMKKKVIFNLAYILGQREVKTPQPANAPAEEAQ